MIQPSVKTAERSTPNSARREEESLVPDARGQLTPAQMVELKLVSMVESSPLLVSHLQDSVKRRPH
jgi:hypothetical protein